MSSILQYRNDPQVQTLLNDPRILGSNSLRSLFDNLRRVAKDNDLGDVAKSLFSKGDAGYQIHVSLIDEEEGFNPRDYSAPEVQESIRILTDRYANDQFVEDITVVVRDGRVLVREGHTRRKSFRKAIEERGANIVRISCRPFAGTREEEDLIPITSNSGNHLKALEAAQIMQRQVERHGKTLQEVAKAIGKTETHVRQSLKLLEMPANMQKLVQDGFISSALALELVAEHGINAHEVAVSAVSTDREHDDAAGVNSETPEKPEKRITRKNLDKGTPAAIKLNKQGKTQLWSTLNSLATKLDVPEGHSESVTVTLTADEARQLKDLHAGFHKQIHGDNQGTDESESEPDGALNS